MMINFIRLLKNRFYFIGFFSIIFQFSFGNNYFPYDVGDENINWDLVSNVKYDGSRGRYKTQVIKAIGSDGELYRLNPVYLAMNKGIKINDILDDDSEIKIGWFSTCFERALSWFIDYSYWERYRWDCRVVVGFRSKNDADLFDYRTTLKTIKERYIVHALLNYRFLVMGILFVFGYSSYLFVRRIFFNKTHG